MADVVNIRIANLEDAERLLEIYSYYVQNTSITFEYEVPTLDEFRTRIQNTLAKYPYLVLEENGVVQGYAYAGTFKGRAAYDWSCELSIYLAQGSNGRGYGRKLYEAMEACLAAMGICNMYACVAYPQVEDEYLTKNSAQFHAHLGFRMVGTFSKCACKFGRWYDMVWMEKFINNHVEGQQPVRVFPEVAGTVKLG